MSLEEVTILKNEIDGVRHTDRMNRRAVVFVHGVLGDRATTWHDREELESFDRLIVNDPTLADYDVFTFGYTTTIWHGSGIKYLAKRLKTGMDELLRRSKEDSRDYHVVLIAHSMGGLVCMRYILDCLEAGQPPPVSGLLLYGTPTTGTGLVALAGLVVAGIALKFPVVRSIVAWWRRRQKQFDDMATASVFLTTLHDQWALRVINGGHSDVEPKQRMWLPVRVVSAENDRFVSEASAKGMYGAIDWQTVDCDHTGLVKPASMDDARYVHARSFLQMVRAANQKVQTHVWNLSQALWRTHTGKLIRDLLYETAIHCSPGDGRTLDPTLAAAGLSVCTVRCRYRGVLAADRIIVGISFGSIGRDEIWQTPEPVCVHSVLLRAVRQTEQAKIAHGLEQVIGRGLGVAWDAFFLRLTVTVNNIELDGKAVTCSPVPPYEWLRREFSLPDKLKSLLGEEVEIEVRYESVVPSALNAFRFPHRWLTQGSTCRITVYGSFDYFIPSQRLTIGQRAEASPNDLPTYRSVTFTTPEVILPESVFEVNWQRIVPIVQAGQVPATSTQTGGPYG